MRTIGVSAICALGLLVVPSAGAARSSSAKCPAGHSRLVVADAQAQIYEAPANASLPEYLDFIGCTYGKKKSYVLGIPPTGGSPTGSSGTLMFTLAGPIVAFEQVDDTELHPGSREEDEIIVRDLRDGKTLHRLPTGTPTAPPEHQDVGIGGATAIILKSDGAVAWIVAVRGTNTEYQVHAVDATGNRVLAASTEIAPSSLALAGSTLYWMQGGKATFAALN